MMYMRAVVYARFSSSNQREESVDAQLRAATEYAQRNNIHIIKMYSDEAKSATTDNRPQFLQMIKDASVGSFDAIIVHKLDRFSRDRFDSAYYMRELKKNNVKLISVLENLDGSPESIMMESLLIGMAEYYSKNLSREVMKGMKETAYQCKHNGGISPLGYDIAEDKSYVINCHESEIIKLIFQLYATGHGYKSIVSILKSKGYKTKLGNDFTQSSLHDILINEKYLGVYIFNRAASKKSGKRNNRESKSMEEIIRIEDGIPAIIDKETFQLVQKRMGSNKRNASNKAKETYLLSGKIFCGECGAAMIGHTSCSGRSKTKYSTYVCGERYRTKNCSMKPIKRDFVEEIVTNDLMEKLLNPYSINHLAEKLLSYYKKLNTEDSRDVKTLEKELKYVEQRINNITDAIAEGASYSSLRNKLSQLEQNQAELLSKISEIQTRSLSIDLDKNMIIQYLNNDMNNLQNKSPDDLKRIIQTYVDKVKVFEEQVEVFLVVHLNGGGEGSRTPVRKHFTSSFSECSHCFRVSSPAAPNDRLCL